MTELLSINTIVKWAIPLTIIWMILLLLSMYIFCNILIDKKNEKRERLRDIKETKLKSDLQSEIDEVIEFVKEVVEVYESYDKYKDKKSIGAYKKEFEENLKLRLSKSGQLSSFVRNDKESIYSKFIIEIKNSSSTTWKKTLNSLFEKETKEEGY